MRHVEHIALIILIGAIGSLAASRIAWMSSTGMDVALWCVATGAWLLVLVCALWHHGYQRSAWHLVWTLVACAVLVAPLDAVFSDDALRYFWDGIVVSSGDNPYASAPLQQPLVTHRSILADGTLLPDDMPYASMRTIYPPGMQLIAGGICRIIGITSAQKFQLAWCICVVIALAAACMLARGVDRLWISIAALSPIVLLHGLADVHSDALMAAAALLGVLALRRGWLLPAAALIAVAISIKYVPVLLVPALLIGRSRSEQVRVIGVVAAVLVAVYLPFLGSPGSVFGSLPVFAENWQANSLPYSLLVQTDGSLFTPDRIRIVLAVIAASLGIGIWWRYHTQPIVAAMMTYITLMLCSPVVHAWYLMLPVLLLPFAPLRSTIVWATTMCVYGIFYATYKGGGVWFEHPVALAIEVIPVWIAFARDLQRGPLLFSDEQGSRSAALA